MDKYCVAVGLVALFVGVSLASGQTTWFVDASATGVESGANWNSAFVDLQDALDVSTNGDEIYVAQGVYKPTVEFEPGVPRSVTFVMVDGVAVRGGFRGLAGGGDPDDRDIDAFETVLSGDIGIVGDDSDNAYNVLRCHDVGVATYVDGVTVTGGNAGHEDSTWRGGGMYATSSSLTVSKCRFRGNSAGVAGGGVYAYEGAPNVIDCVFSDNSAGTPGDVQPGAAGGMWIVPHANQSRSVVANCTFVGNSSEYVGGGLMTAVASGGSLIVTNCVFIGNSAYNGGGMINQGGNAEINNCMFYDNNARNVGGGLWSCTGNATFTNCLFRENFAAVAGGGVCHTDCHSTMANCTLVGNRAGSEGGGVYSEVDSWPTVANCTLVGNVANDVGGGISSVGASWPEFVNCVIWDNTAPVGSQVNDSSDSDTTVSYSCIQDGWLGTGNTDDDPLFVRLPDDGGDGWGDDPNTLGIDEGANDDYGDLRLGAGSACIDAGDNGAVPVDRPDLDNDGDVSEKLPLDIGGGPRFLDDWATPDTGYGSGPIVDMGAYEYGVGPGDCDGDGYVDEDDLETFVDCMAGPGGFSPMCGCGDFDADGDVDLIDFGMFQSLIPAW